MMDTYNLFRRVDDHAIHCAVPQDAPVPSFLRAPGWTFHASAEAKTITIPGFAPDTARSSAGMAGYHVFIAGAGLVRCTERPLLQAA